jgi:hypothetical protein
MKQPPIGVSGIWLRRIGDRAEVLVEIHGTWRLVITEHVDAVFSHIANPSAIANAPHDPVTFDRSETVENTRWAIPARGHFVERRDKRDQ